MSISRTFRKFSNPVGSGNAKISLGTFGYVTEYNRHLAYGIVLSEFKNSGITQATLASRMGKPPEVISRLLSRPQNWESDTFSAMLFAISGAIPSYSLEYPLRRTEGVEIQQPPTSKEPLSKPTEGARQKAQTGTSANNVVFANFEKAAA